MEESVTKKRKKIKKEKKKRTRRKNKDKRILVTHITPHPHNPFHTQSKTVQDARQQHF